MVSLDHNEFKLSAAQDADSVQDLSGEISGPDQNFEKFIKSICEEMCKKLLGLT